MWGGTQVGGQGGSTTPCLAQALFWGHSVEGGASSWDGGGLSLTPLGDEAILRAPRLGGGSTASCLAQEPFGGHPGGWVGLSHTLLGMGTVLGGTQVRGGTQLGAGGAPSWALRGSTSPHWGTTSFWGHPGGRGVAHSTLLGTGAGAGCAGGPGGGRYLAGRAPPCRSRWWWRCPAAAASPPAAPAHTSASASPPAARSGPPAGDTPLGAPPAPNNPPSTPNHPPAPAPCQQGIRYRERLGPFLDDEALDDVGEDLGFHDGLGGFVLTIVGGGPGDGGGRAPGARGHAGKAGQRRGGLRMKAVGGRRLCGDPGGGTSHALSVTGDSRGGVRAVMGIWRGGVT